MGTQKNKIQKQPKFKIDLVLPLNGFFTLLLLTVFYGIAKKELAKQDVILEKEKTKYEMFLDSINTQKQDSSVIAFKQFQQNTK